MASMNSPLDSGPRAAAPASIATGSRAAFVLLVVALGAPGLAAQCSAQWLPGLGVAGVTGPATQLSVEACTYWDPDGAGPAAGVVACGGDFVFAGSVVANHIATYDPASGAWSPLGT